MDSNYLHVSELVFILTYIYSVQTIQTCCSFDSWFRFLQVRLTWRIDAFRTESRCSAGTQTLKQQGYWSFMMSHKAYETEKNNMVQTCKLREREGCEVWLILLFLLHLFLQMKTFKHPDTEKDSSAPHFISFIPEENRFHLSLILNAEGFSLQQWRRLRK